MPSEARSNTIADVGCGIQMQNAMHALLSHKESEIGQYLIYGHLNCNVSKKSLPSNPERSPCLVPFKIPKLYKIPHHIESLNACMKC